jgi:DNA (cytosine-5)-methyltransferase 1
MGELKSTTFIDLFAGIGGIRIAFENAGAICVFSSEWDEKAQKTYEANFNEIPAGDITKIPINEIPDHDILTGGFPCQPFSIAGVSKNNSLGNLHGFEHKEQGNLFFEVAKIIQEKKPKAFLLENVKNLVSHNKGNTFKTIRKVLENDLHYRVYYKIIDASLLLPQHRERIYIVGFRDEINFEFPEIEDRKQKLKDILEKKVSSKYILTDHLWKYLQDYAVKQKSKGNGFGFGLASLDGITRTLSARYYKDGSEILVPTKNRNPRRLTPRECARLMGFPDSYRIVCSDTSAYKQFGNSVAIPVVELIAKNIVRCLKEPYFYNTQPFQPRILEPSGKY